MPVDGKRRESWFITWRKSLLRSLWRRISKSFDVSAASDRFRAETRSTRSLIRFQPQLAPLIHPPAFSLPATMSEITLEAPVMGLNLSQANAHTHEGRKSNEIIEQLNDFFVHTVKVFLPSPSPAFISLFLIMLKVRDPRQWTDSTFWTGGERRTRKQKFVVFSRIRGSQK